MNKAQRIRAIFEGNVIAMYSPDDERYKAAEKANRRRVSMQAQARAEQARGSHVTAGQKTIDTLGKNLSPEMLRKVMQKDIKAHHERRRKSMNSSTNYYRAGLRALFESVIEEADIYQKSARTPHNPVKASSVLIKKMSKSSKPGMSKQDADKAARAGIAKSNYHKALKGMAARKAADPYDYDYDMYYEAQDPKKLQRLQNKRLKPMTAWGATIKVLPKAKTRSQKKVDKKAAELRAKETDYPDPQDP